ncbi:MAG: hypothetical protein BroJett033_7860 [Chloroflexota bacterium]|nr:MAG: hypothetical protein BroJett033_7860 [Chloroflexota bacterium]
MYAQLRGVAPWGERVQPLAVASSGLAKPYAVFFAVSSGRAPSVPVRDLARHTVSVKAVALDLATALGAQEAISGLLHNAGEQDVNPRLAAHPEWHVLTVTEGRAILIEEKFDGGLSIYHAGHQYDWLMERRV